ncbi:hypothetical protein ABZW49_16075 [Nonomuraea wenchangensis]
MSTWEIILSVVGGLIVNEMSSLSPWLAGKLVVWSARHQYNDPARAAARAEELSALIANRPGKLGKLCTAMGFTSAAIATELRRYAHRAVHGSPSKTRGTGLTWWARLYLATVVMIAGTVLASIALSKNVVTLPWGLLLLTALICLACESFPPLVANNMALSTASMSVLVTASLAGPQAAALVGLACALGIRPSLPWIKRLYNGAQVSLAGYLAGTVYQALDATEAMPLVIRYAIATVIFIMANTILVAVMVKLAAGPGLTIWTCARHMSPFMLIYLGGNALSLATVLLWPHIGPYSTTLLIAPYMVRYAVHHLHRDRRIGTHRRVKTLP